MNDPDPGWCDVRWPQQRDFASADATKGLSDRPLETFGDMSGETARAEAMLNLLMRAVTVNDAPVVPVEKSAAEE